ncbi:MAG: cyclic pyranopterin monophosphate synthase MoaC [Candidatus Bathyarchaeia archaeon]
MSGQLKRARMVDVTEKPEVHREASASGRLRLKPETIQLIKEGKTVKGDPIAVAEVAAVLAAKNTPQVIPFCHNLFISDVETRTTLARDAVTVNVRVKASGKTGVEMEALTATAAYLLTFWDMVKAHEKDEGGQYPHTAIEWIKVERKEKRSPE